MRFKSTIFVKEGTQARWFDLPVFDWKKSTMRDIKERVFVDRFSRKRYAELDEQYFGNHEETITEDLENLNIGDHETNTEGVEILNIVPDDWEDSLIITDSASFMPLIEADRGSRISPSVVHTATDTLVAKAASTRGERYRDDRQGGDGGGGRYGGARQGRSGGDDHQGGGGSGRHGDDRSGRGALGRRSGKERTDCRPCGTGVIITKKDGIIHVESKHQKNSRMQRKEAAKARIIKKKRGKERKRLAKKVAEEAEAAAKAMKAAAKAKKAATKAKKTAAKAEGLENLNYGLI